MTEKTRRYEVAGAISSLNKMKSLPCVLPSCHPDYKPPTPEEVDIFIQLSGWTQREVALITGVRQTIKGSTSVRRWKTKVGDKEYRQIPNSSWQLLLIHAGLGSVKETRSAINKYFPGVVRNHE